MCDDVRLRLLQGLPEQLQQQSRSHHHPQGPGTEPGGASAAGSSQCPSSSQYTLPSSDSSSTLHVPMRTTFSLLPEDNPFQDITIGSLLGWGSYGRVHRGGTRLLVSWLSAQPDLPHSVAGLGCQAVVLACLHSPL